MREHSSRRSRAVLNARFRRGLRRRRAPAIPRRRIAIRPPTSGGGSGGGEEEFILMAIELSTVKNNTGMAKYSFVNILHLDSQNAYDDYTAGGNGPFSENKSYLKIFEAPAGAEN